MAGQDQQTQQQNQQSKTDPWAPAQPILQKLLDSYGGQSTAVTGGQQAAADNMVAATSNIPNFGDAGSKAVTNLFNSSTDPQVGMLSDSYNKLKNNIGNTASGAELNPYSTPGFSDALKTMTSDITNQVKGVYAGSGRDPSGAGSFAGSLGRGLTQGIAPVIQSQFNKNKDNQMTAAGTEYNAGNTTAGAITGQQQVPLTNAATALGLTPAAATAYTVPGQTQLNAANTQYNLPWANLAQLLAPGAQIAGLGGSSSGASTATTVQPQNTMSNIMGGVSGGLGMLALMSDERVKDEIEPIGKLNDGQNVVRFRYKGDPRMRIGLLAQEVENFAPDAVHDVGAGLLAVDHRLATDKAAKMGRAA